MYSIIVNTTKNYLLILTLCCISLKATSESKFIKVGILHSLTGTMSLSESKVVNTVLLALNEINNSGGLLGKNLKQSLKTGSLILMFLLNKLRFLSTKKK